MSKVYIVGGGPSYADMFQRQGWEVVDYPEDADALQFTGGADVTPVLYGQKPHPETFTSPLRDADEASLFDRFKGELPMLGICRGSQFLNVMNGGKLYQHVDGHALRGTHACRSEVLGKIVEVTSTHHQMMIPAPHAEVEGTAWKLSTRKEYMDGTNIVSVPRDTDPTDTEAVWYADTRSLCFQPHPEFYGAESTREYYFALINHYLGL